jgi:hypothetical protein
MACAFFSGRAQFSEERPCFSHKKNLSKQTKLPIHPNLPILLLCRPAAVSNSRDGGTSVAVEGDE